MKRLFAIFAAAASIVLAAAQDQPPVIRPVTSAYMLEGGTGHLADTYLTPLHYRGSHFDFSYDRQQAMRFCPELWTMQLRLGLGGSYTESPTKNANMLDLAVDASWGMMRRWRLPRNITLGIGPYTGLTLGCLYLSRNGNNPASAKAAWVVGATGYAQMRLSVLRRDVTLRYQPSMPLVGAFFSPDYGQLYYQIYMGDDKGLSHCAWPGNFFRLDNLLTADINLGGTSLRLGYRAQIFSSRVNNIVSRDISHALVIGLTTEWISLRPGRSLPADAKIISATY